MENSKRLEGHRGQENGNAPAHVANAELMVGLEPAHIRATVRWNRKAGPACCDWFATTEREQALTVDEGCAMSQSARGCCACSATGLCPSKVILEEAPSLPYGCLTAGSHTFGHRVRT